MKLKKRDCPIKIEFQPLGNELVEMRLLLDGDEYVLRASSVMCGQVNQLMSAVYQLYTEAWDSHRTMYRPSHKCDGKKVIVTSGCIWRTDSNHVLMEFSRLQYDGEYETRVFDPDIVSIKIGNENTAKEYAVEGRDLAYSIGKAGTKVLKEYGFYGYSFSTGSRICNGDTIDINHLLFLKAYALNAMDVRKLKTVRKSPKSWQSYDVSPFDNELALLLFDL